MDFIQVDNSMLSEVNKLPVVYTLPEVGETASRCPIWNQLLCQKPSGHDLLLRRLLVCQRDTKDQNSVRACDVGRVALPPHIFEQENTSGRKATYSAVTRGYFVFALQ